MNELRADTCSRWLADQADDALEQILHLLAQELSARQCPEARLLEESCTAMLRRRLGLPPVLSRRDLRRADPRA